MDKTLLLMTLTTVNPITTNNNKLNHNNLINTTNNSSNLTNNPNLNNSTTTTTRTTTMSNPHRPLPTGTPSSTPTTQHTETLDTTRMQLVTSQEGLLRDPVLLVSLTVLIVLEPTPSLTLMIPVIGLDMLLLFNLLLDQFNNSNSNSQASTTIITTTM